MTTLLALQWHLSALHAPWVGAVLCLVAGQLRKVRINFLLTEVTGVWEWRGQEICHCPPSFGAVSVVCLLLLLRRVSPFNWRAVSLPHGAQSEYNRG